MIFLRSKPRTTIDSGARRNHYCDNLSEFPVDYSNGVTELDRQTGEFLKALAAVLKSARKEAGWSQNEMAWRSGLSQQHISYLERELRSPSADSLKRISLALDRELAGLIREAERKSGI